MSRAELRALLVETKELFRVLLEEGSYSEAERKGSMSLSCAKISSGPGRAKSDVAAATWKRRRRKGKRRKGG